MKMVVACMQMQCCYSKPNVMHVQPHLEFWRKRSSPRHSYSCYVRKTVDGIL